MAGKALLLGQDIDELLGQIVLACEEAQDEGRWLVGWKISKDLYKKLVILFVAEFDS